MRVLFVNHNSYLEEVTGAEKSLYYDVRALLARGVEAAVLSRKEGLSTEYFRSLGVPVFVCPYEPEPVRDVIARVQPHVVYVNTIAPVAVATAARALGAPVLWVVREIPNDRLERVGILAREASLIVAVSGAVRRHLYRLGVRRPIAKLFNAVPLNDWREQTWARRRAERRRALHLTEEQVAIGFVGKVSRKKGIEHFVTMARLIGRRRKDAVFLIFGHVRDEREALMRHLRRCAETAGLRRRIMFCGFEEDVEKIYPALDVVVVPSLSDEPFGRVTAEAMAFRKPVVAYDSGASKEIIVHGRTGFVVPKGHVELLSHAVLQLFDPALRRRFGAEGRRRVEELFDMPKHADALLELLHRCARRADGSRWRPAPTAPAPAAAPGLPDQRPPEKLRSFVGTADDPPLPPWGSFQARQAAIQRLAQMQARFLFRNGAGRQRAGLSSLPNLLDAVRAAHEQGALRRELERCRSWLPREHGGPKLVEKALRRVPKLIAQLEKGPATLAHGDVRWHNMRLGGDGAVRFVHWSRSAFAPVPYDLALWLEETLALYPEYSGRQKELRDWAIDTYRRRFAKFRRPLPRKTFIRHYQLSCLLQILSFALWEHARRAAAGCPSSQRLVAHYMSRLAKWGKKHGIIG